MSANVTPLFDGAEVVAPGHPVQGVIDMLRRYLEQAEAGAISAIAVVAVTPNGNATTEWVDAGGLRHDLAAGVMRLSFRVARTLDGGDE